MRMLWALLVLALPLAACGHKGKLKSPEQIEQEQAKKERKAAKKKQSEPVDDAYTRESQQVAPEATESQ